MEDDAQATRADAHIQGVTARATASARASSLQTDQEFQRSNRLWMAVLVLVVIASSAVSGFIFTGWPSFAVGVCGGVVGCFVGYRAVWKLHQTRVIS